MGSVIGNMAWAEFPDRIYIAKDRSAEILLGDILKVVDMADVRKSFLIRVTGAVQGESSEAEALSKEILLDPNFRKVAEARGPTEIFIGSLLCSFKPQLRGGLKPYIPKELPTRHSSVVLPDLDDLSFIEDLEEKGYDLDVGILRVRGDLKIPVRLKGEDLPRHVSVYAVTGKGKTGFVKALLYAVAKAPRGRYAALVYDAHDEYYKTIQPSLVGLKELNWENIHYYDLHDPRTPKIALQSISAEDLSSIYPDLTEAQREASILLNASIGSGWLNELARREYNGLKELREKFSIPPAVRDSTLGTLWRKAKVISSRPSFTQESTPDLISVLEEKLDGGDICILNTRNLSDLEEGAVLSLATSRLLDGRKKLVDREPEELQRKPIILIVLEEALSVLSERVLRRGSNIFSELVREGRKYRVGLLTVVQIPHRLDPDVAGNINTNVILGLAQERGRRTVAENAMDDMEPLVEEMKMLDVGEAIISFPHKGEVPFPLPARIHYFNDLVEAEKKTSTDRRTVKLHRAFAE